MLLLLVLATIIAVGLTAIVLAEPRRDEIVVWSDEAERRLLHEGRVRVGWW
jgi:hypothetical protein